MLYTEVILQSIVAILNAVRIVDNAIINAFIRFLIQNLLINIQIEKRIKVYFSIETLAHFFTMH